MGKEKILQNDNISYILLGRLAPAVIRLGFAALAAGCAVGRPDRFAGPLQPQAGTCDPPSRAELILNDSHVLFTPREGVISLEGALAADGTISANATSSGMDRTPYHQTFIGNLTGDRVTGTYSTQRCRYLATLAATRR
jgi:hypothetical protein